MAARRVLAALLALALISALPADAAERGRGGSRAGGGRGGPACTAARGQPAAVSAEIVLPNRVVRNSNRAVGPLAYFDVGHELGSGAFGRVLLASLKAAKPAAIDTVENSPVRMFAIKEQVYFQELPCGPDPRPTAVRRSSRTEPQLMQRVSGGPYIVKYWGH
ncbi:hypothetical protein DFJ74DRAFT_711105 [Hyaloraphidium curvatum]|nr:hypothetical protein DFJ74DRAFT_711105 [Hyaloraphidium curvatum]